ncbi:DUF6760 family protein [Pantanalinema rosaneae CENA516]|uniref:DUF6760 family protein n=1 Tax=Pantanalinema rosaneae TaxID=1620701 RepID=UPI003D6F8852
MQQSFSSGVSFIGGILGYPSEKLQEEVAFIAYHFHWSLEDVLGLVHRDRQGWVEEIIKIRQRTVESMLED